MKGKHPAAQINAASFRKEREHMRLILTVIVAIPVLYILVLFLTAWL